MARDLAAQRAPRQHADADRPHALLARENQQPIVVLRGVAHRQRVGSGRVQQVENHLRGVDRPAGERTMERAGLPRGGDPEEAHLALLLQPSHRRHHCLQHARDAERPLLAHAPDQVVQVQQVHPRESESREARLHGARDRARHVGQIGGPEPPLGPDDHGGPERTQHLAQVLLRLARPVRRRGVEVVDPVLQRARHAALPLGRRAPHHQPAHVPAAEAQRGDLQPGSSQRSVFHGRWLYHGPCAARLPAVGGSFTL